MNPAAETLRTLEARSERAIVQELRLMVREVRAMRAFLIPEDQAHADALLLKLGRLQAEQSVGDVAADEASPQQPDLAPAPSLAVPAPATRITCFQAEYCDVEG